MSPMRSHPQARPLAVTMPDGRALYPGVFVGADRGARDDAVPFLLAHTEG
jgi:hypothetical protein